MMNRSKPCSLRAILRGRLQSGGGQDFGCPVPPHPSPLPQGPQGEGETFVRALVIRSGSVVVCLRNERPRSADCNPNVRIFQRRARALPLLGDLGERVGVRENQANFDPRRTTIPGTVKLREPPGRAGVSQFGL